LGVFYAPYLGEAYRLWAHGDDNLLKYIIYFIGMDSAGTYLKNIFQRKGTKMRNPIAYIACAFMVSLNVSTAYAEDPPALAAEPASPHTITGNLGFFSDYRFRGISQTVKNPAIQGGFDYAHASGFYAGTWASNVSGYLYANANMEWDFYGGYNYKLNDDIGLTAGGLYYFYPSGKTGADKRFDTFEANFGGNWKWVSGKLWYSVTDFFGATDPKSKGSTYVEVNATFPLSELKTGNAWLDKVSLVGHLGHQKVKNYKDFDYTD
jgi:uncharacterized protein (TIGR02001 family)